MKLQYRGATYEYNPTEVTYSDCSAVGKYRGMNFRLCNVRKLPVLQPALDLIYRGAHTRSNNSAIAAS
jgi:hypothetical protein